MNKLFSILSLGLALSCADAADMTDADIQELEQDYTAPNSTNYQFGVRTTASHRQCDKVSTGQVCSVPKTKAIKWCINPGFTNEEINIISGIVNSYDTALSTWTFTYDSDVVTGLCKGTNNLQFTPGACGVSGSASNEISDYVCTTFTGVTNLTEGVIGSDPVGSYQAHSLALSKIDIAGINPKYAVGSPRNNAKKHATAYGVLTAIGLGGRTDASANNFASKNVISPLAVGLLTAGEQCRANNFQINNSTDFSVNSVCAGAD